ncbi:fungal-specific transcription factor domain-containing protein [Scheffersomyces amazonensis]|uniref:fungal-specific transcription factor domain-containing protein n=1 Tax=Scheffersomyces amazonensis TaxID=1078765 RepID=UPI00315CE9DC
MSQSLPIDLQRAINNFQPNLKKSKMKSILPKPSPIPAQTPSPGISNIGTPNGRRKTKSSISGSSNINMVGSNINVGGDSKRQKKSISEVVSNPDRSKQSGHRPVTSCTFCRQHKIKCNASDNYPSPCQRCDKMGLKCEIDPEFRPKKGSQIQSLKSDVDELKAKIEMLTKNESLLTQALNQHNLNYLQQQSQPQSQSINQYPIHTSSITSGTPRALSTNDMMSPVNFRFDQSPQSFSAAYNLSPGSQLNDSVSNTQLGRSSLPHILQENSDNSPISNQNTPNIKSNEFEIKEMSEFILGDVKLPLQKADELHETFMTKRLPFLPIITSKSATELYHRSQLLFWAVILTASLSEPEPTLYMSLASLIKQLAIETCWIRTPRSTHVIQALIILSIWPLPNEKVLDDCSYRFIGLAKNLSLQLGLHRGGKFIQEFTRTQVSLGPDAEKWRTRSWLAVFFCEQFWSSTLGLPPSINTTDYLLENARVDQSLPKDFRCLISLAIFQCKLVNVMGISVTRPDGLLEPSNRAASLNILDRELERLKFKLNIVEGSAIEVYYHYIKLMICVFAFLPGTPIEDQVKYVSSSYLSATRIVTITSQMINNNISLIELPIYVRQSLSYSVLLLFKLHLSKYLLDKYVDSSRQSIVTVHRLFRNTLSSWKDLQNDISRNAKVLENLNIVLYTYPDILINDDSDAGGSIISRMRSHLTASLFYDLVWCVHEARRRTLLDKNKSTTASKPNLEDSFGGRRPAPLPFYNQITKDDFKTMTTITPNGTTITTLIPTDQALSQAKSNAATMNKPLEINGIPLSMLEATGSINDNLLKREVGSPTPKPEESIQPPTERLPPKVRAPSLQSQTQPQSQIQVQSQAPIQQLPPPHINQFTPQISQNQSFAPLHQLQSQSQSQSQTQQPPKIDQPMFLPGSDQIHLQQNIPPTPIPFITGPNADGNIVADQLDNFFQQQSNGWINNDNIQDDDFLGWFDYNLNPDR